MKKLNRYGQQREKNLPEKEAGSSRDLLSRLCSLKMNIGASHRIHFRFAISALWGLFLACSLCAIGSGFCSQTELGSAGDLFVAGTDGTGTDPNVALKGFTIFGATQSAYVGAVVGPGNVVVNGALAVSSGAYFAGNSTFTSANNIFVNDGSAGQILSKNGAGSLQWTSSSGLGDNLGNHLATQDLQMAGWQVSNAGAITASSYTATGTGISAAQVRLAAGTIAISSETSVALGAGVRVSTNMYVVGFTSATKYYGDGSGLTGVITAGDNLGNHIATTTLQMGIYGVNSSSNITAANYQIAGSTVLSLTSGGITNVAVGVQAGNVNTGSNNSFLGSQAGYNNTTGNSNSFLGNQAGYTNTTGFSNSFLGYLTGYGNTTGSKNSFLGFMAGYSNTTGSDNSFLGSRAGVSNTTGSSNAVLGDSADINNPTGSADTIMGVQAGFGVSGNSFSSATLVGYYAGYGLTTGNDNILVGFQAGKAITSGADNIVIGYNQDAPLPTSNSTLNIGGVLYGDLSAKTIGISRPAPQAALDIVSTGTAANIYAQMWSNSSGVIVASMTSTGTLYATVANGDNLGNHTATQQLNMNNFAIWSSSDITAANYQIAGSTVLSLTAGGGFGTVAVGVKAGNVNTSGYDTFLGDYAGYKNTTGSYNSFLGYMAGYSNTTGYNNSFVGYYAGESNTTSIGNTFLGSYAGYSNTGGYNSFLGNSAGTHNTTGNYNSIVGNLAGDYNQTGSGNTIMGNYAGYGVTGNSFSNATLVGYYAGYGLTTGNDNILIGYQAGKAITTGADNIVIGFNQDAPTPTSNSTLNIGGLIYGDLLGGKVGIGATSPTYAKLVVQNAGDGTPALQLTTTGTKAACAAAYRGAVFYEQGASGATDKLYICMKNSSDIYQWVLAAQGS